MSITVIGDTHLFGEQERIRRYKEITDKYPFTVQLGDCDFDYDWMSSIDSENHKLIPGNHDNHESVYKLPHCLGRFGYFRNAADISFFYVGGAHSIDRTGRKEYVEWWPNEELSYKEMYDCTQLYQQIRPDLVLTHDCPQIVAQMLFGITDYSHTRNGLQWMFELHKPNLWVFGHHHKPREEEVLGTKFVCLGILETLEIKLKERKEGDYKGPVKWDYCNHCGRFFYFRWYSGLFSDWVCPNCHGSQNKEEPW